MTTLVPLTIGARVGAYEVVSALGAGGMGEVYRAHDAALHRDVALKILAPAFADNPERLARFDREAQLLASLNHPNIAQIYGLETLPGHDSARALVLELVEGPTLADRIASGAIPFDESIHIARQIADALEAAHEQGIVHRDLKPANVKVRDDGMVKVLDFGLAKALEATSAGSSSVSMSPTLTAATQAGLILGTAAYMAPEQARGKAVDKRADIWAFGCVLYEMLTGRRAFAGEEVSDTLAYVITRDVDWTQLPADTPPHVRRVLRRCLDKDPRRRMRDIGDARMELDERPIPDEPNAPAAIQAAATKSAARRALPWMAGIVLGSAITAIIAWSMRPSASAVVHPVQRFPITIPASIRYVGEAGGRLAISPDGARLVFPGIDAGKRLLYTRNLDQLEAQPIRGTDDAYNPFFSPDGEWIGFFTAAGTPGGKLKKIAVRGGPPLTLADTSVPTGVWTADDTIVFTRGGGASWELFRVPAAGGSAARLTKPDADQKEVRHAWPEELPGGRHLLFSVTTGAPSFDQSHIAVLSLDTGKYRTVVEQGHQAHYLASGHIVYALAGNLMAVPFDAQRLQVTGPPVPIVEGVRGRTSTGEVSVGVSRGGLLVYGPGTTTTSNAQRTMVWVDRAGKEEPLPVPPRSYAYPRLSPDGSRIALDIRDQNLDIWIWDLSRRTLTRLTSSAGPDNTPVWTPDGKRILFASQRMEGFNNLFWQPSDGTGQPERLLESPTGQLPQAVSPDGTRLVFRQTAGGDLDTLSLVGDRRVTPLLHTPFVELNAEVSPDGRWLAYQSNDSGVNEVYVRPFPNADGGKWQISAGGGANPLWSRDGRELFFQSGTDAQRRLMAAPIAAGAAFSAGTARTLFEGAYLGPALGLGGRTYDVSLDGKRFLMIKDLTASDPAASASAPLVAVLNVFDELTRLAPPKR